MEGKKMYSSLQEDKRDMSFAQFTPSPTLAPAPIFTFTASTAFSTSPTATSSTSASSSTSSPSTRWVRRLHHRQRNHRERNLLFSRMIHAAGGGGNSNSDSNNIISNGSNINGNNSSTIPSTVPSTTLSTSSSSSPIIQSQDDDDLQSMHHHFRSKTVCKLNCAHCNNSVCVRGMKAMLLADTRIELYSTDVPPLSVQLVGYHITQPCQQCMEACNNGHLWMFHTESVTSEERLDPEGKKILLWAQLPRAEKDIEIIDTEDEYEQCCR
ncbi:7934_t:CDS:2 [Funneliformis geosporum]|nr:7934_t:CDS:2 [Funneliformis geosporum]